MDQQACGGVLSMPKDSIVLGTYETSAFILSLRDRDEFSRLHPSGYHCIPHIGTYGQDYTLSLPMVLISVPATPSYLQKLPTDLLNALDLEPILPSQNTTTTPMVHAVSTPQTGMDRRGMNKSELYGCQSALHCQIRTVALELVKNAILSACRRVSVSVAKYDGFWGPNQQDLRMGSKCGGLVKSDWTTTKRGSSVSMESEGYVSASSGFNTSRNASLHDQSSSTVDIPDEELEREVRIVAKKLVNKVLHIACKNVESLYRRSSIEYLVASTKRMKITESPSPPLTLFNIVEEQGEVQGTNHTVKFSQGLKGKTERSPTPEGHRTRKLGSKRKRSGSHDVAMQDDRDQKKQFGHGNQFSDEKQRVTKVVTRRHVQKESEEQNSTMLSTSELFSVHVGDLTTNIDRLSLVVDSESDIEENYTILSAVTKPTSGGYTEASRDHEQAHRCGHFTRQESESKTFPSGLPLQDISQIQNFDEESQSCNAKMAGVPSIVLNDTCVPNSDVILDIDLFITIHSHPPSSLCQKILCSNVDEVNLVYHCWLYKDSPFDPGVTLSSKLEMGVFDAHLVQPVHLELHDGGVPFSFLDERTVCIHNCCFSPENAQLQLLSPHLSLPNQQHSHEHSFHSFFSAARHGCRRVIAFHIIPSSSLVEGRVRESIRGCSNLGQLLTVLKNTFPEVGEKLTHFILPKC